MIMHDCPYVWVLCENERENEKSKEGKGSENENRAACDAVCSCNLHRGREVAEELRYCDPPGKVVKRGLPGARGRKSWDPIVADPSCVESSRETGLTWDRRSGGATSEERGERKHVVRGHGLPTVH